MYPRTNYEMTEADMKIMFDACKPTPAMWGSGGAQMFSTPQENANRAWAELGKKMGFDSETVQPIVGMPSRFFSAVPSETEPQRQAREAMQATDTRNSQIESLRGKIAEMQRQLDTLTNCGQY